MATAKKVRKTSRATKMREYFTANPTATVSAVAKHFKTSYQVAYMAKKTRKIILERAEVELANKLGISTMEYAKQKAILLKNPKVQLPTPDLPITMEEPKADPVNHPTHYKVGGIETIDFIEAKSLSYHLGNVVKYVTRADHKGNRKQDLEKAKWYLERAISQL